MALTEEEKGYTAEDWAELGKMGRAKQVTESGGGKWSTDLHKSLKAAAAKTERGKDTQKYKDWTQGASGFSDVYRSGASEIKGPEHGIPDVDIHGYPTGWKQEAGTKDGAEGQYITTKDGHTYFKPTQEQHLSGGGDTSTGSGDSTVTTSLRPDQTPSLREITSDMDLRNMITNILDTNSPLFKMAQTRALQNQARIGGGRINASMGRDSVVAALLGEAKTIALEVTNTFKEAMHKYADTSDAFKLALNKAYYDEMIARVNNANQVKLRQMTEAGANWRSVMDAKSRGIEAKTAPAFERYMGMFGNV